MIMVLMSMMMARVPVMDVPVGDKVDGQQGAPTRRAHGCRE